MTHEFIVVHKYPLGYLCIIHNEFCEQNIKKCGHPTNEVCACIKYRNEVPQWLQSGGSTPTDSLDATH